MRKIINSACLAPRATVPSAATAGPVTVITVLTRAGAGAAGEEAETIPWPRGRLD